MGDDGAFEGVPRRNHANCGLVWRFAVEGGVDIAAAGEQDAIEDGQKAGERAFAELRGEEEGDTAGLLNGFEVGGVELDARHLPDGGGSDADDWRHVVMVAVQE
jgi:hypothetical protein